ncbi:MAG: hypothetical protein ABI583_14985, partial [Betaproteobacteria bacterium]
MFKNKPIVCLILLGAVNLSSVAASTEDSPVSTIASASWRGSADRLIVKFRERVTANTGLSASQSTGRSMRELSDSAGLELTYVREMATGAQVLSLPQSLPLAEVEAIAKKIAANPAVE